uniref:Uncharacterized protein n=1 Tax=Bactrocera dorsalis TaxID=27457 RepID=A0A034WNX2_BACDO
MHGPGRGGFRPGPGPARVNVVMRPPGPPRQVNVNINAPRRPVVNEVVVVGGAPPLLPAAGMMLGASMVAGAAMGAVAASAMSGPREVIVNAPPPQPSTVIVNTPGVQQPVGYSGMGGAPPSTTVIIEGNAPRMPPQPSTTVMYL